MRTHQFIQLAMIAGVLLFASRPLAQDADEIVSNPEVQFNAERVKREVNYSLREAMNWERQARDLQRQGQPEKAVEAWREAFARYETLWRDWLSPDKPTENEPLACAITPSAGKDRDLSPQYIENWIPLPDYLNGRMRLPDWPRQFKDRVAMRQTGPGQEVFNRALANQDMKLIRRVARYFQFSPSGLKALRLLAEVALERGDSLLAARWLEELGLAHPDEYRRDPYLWVQLIRACRESDTRFYLAKALSDFERNARDVTIDVGGATVNALEYARDLAAKPVPADRDELSRPGWLTMMGNASRNRVAPPVESITEMVDLVPGAGIQGYQLSSKASNDNREEEYRYYGPPQKQVDYLNFPTVHSSGVYIHQLAASVPNQPNQTRPEQMLGFAHGNEQRPLPMTIKAGAEYPAPKNDNNRNRYYYYERATRSRNRILASTVGRLTWAVEPRESEVLFAIIGEGNPSTDDGATRTGNQIQAFDLTQEGKHLVTLPNEKIESPDDWKMLQRIVFNGAPLVRDNKLYVSGTRAMRGSTECWVFCFDVTPRGDSSRGEGKLQWKTMICAKKAQGNMGWGEDLPAEAVEVSSLAEQGGMLYISTHMGACAGLDRDTGELCWAAKYDRPRNTNELGWTGNAPIASGGMVIIAPDDSRFAFVLDGIWGKKMFEHPMRGRGAVGEFTYVLGVVDNSIIIQGRHKLYSVALTSYRSGGTRRNAADWGSLNWETENSFDSIPCGRGVIAGKKILVPLKDSIAFYDVESGKLATKFPLPDDIDHDKDLYTLSVYCRGEAKKDVDGTVRGYKQVSVIDPATGSEYSVEHLRNGDSFTCPGSGKVLPVQKETFVVMASCKWMYLFKATDK